MGFPVAIGHNLALYTSFAVVAHTTALDLPEMLSGGLKQFNSTCGYTLYDLLLPYSLGLQFEQVDC